MKTLRISQKSGSALSLELVQETDTDQILISVRQWTGEGVSIACTQLDILEIQKLINFCDKFIQDRKEQLTSAQQYRIQRNFMLQRIYTDSELSGFFTSEQLLELKNIDISISHLLAKDLNVSVVELYKIVEATPLPFALFKKHFAQCREQLNERLFLRI